MKKRIAFIAFLIITVAVIAAFYAGFRALVYESLDPTFYRKLDIVWVDETKSASGKIIEIPFTIYVNSMGEEEHYTRRLKIGKIKSVKLKMGHYKLAPGFDYESPPDYDITIEPCTDWFWREDNTLTITVHEENADER